MRQNLACGLLALALFLAPDRVFAADPAKFDLLGFKLGMTAEQVERVTREAQFTNIRKDAGPSFEQAVSLQRRQLVRGQDYNGIRMLKAERKDALVQVFFVAATDAPRAFKFEIEILPAAADLPTRLTAKYAEPDKRTDRAWLWGDTAEFFYARTKAYLEYQPSPFSLSGGKSIARFILVDPSIQKEAEDAVKAAAGRAS